MAAICNKFIERGEGCVSVVIDRYGAELQELMGLSPLVAALRFIDDLSDNAQFSVVHQEPDTIMVYVRWPRP